MKWLGELRDIEDAQVEMIRGWRNQERVRRFMYNQHVISVNEHQAWWAKTKERADSRYLIYFDDGVANGVVSFAQIDKVESCCSWAFYASGEAPRGTGSRMEFLAIDYAFQIIEIDKLNCEVLSSNQSVLKLHSNFGFYTEVIISEGYVSSEKALDIHHLALHRSDWEKNRANILSHLKEKWGN